MLPPRLKAHLPPMIPAAPVALFLLAPPPLARAQWVDQGVLVASGSGNQQYEQVVPDGAGGSIIVWEGQGGLGSDIYAQRIDTRYGYWGSLAGEIASAEDAPGDQGGVVELKWGASRLDVFGEQVVSHYSVWRAVPPAMVSALAAKSLVAPSAVGPDFSGPAYRVERTPAGDYYWEWVGNTNASYFSGYSYAVPTLSDSTGSHPAIHYFQVLTHTADPYVFWISMPDSGYSVDNISPSPPQGLAGSYDYATGMLALRWRPNTEPDLSHYAVYRGVGPDFVPSPQDLIATSSDTVVTGLPYPPEQPYYIKLSALDVHGNESSFTLLPPESVATATLVTSFKSVWRDGYVEVS